MSGGFVTHYEAQQDIVDSIFHPSFGAKRPSSRSNNEGTLRLLTEYMIPGKGVDAWGPDFWERPETYADHPSCLCQYQALVKSHDIVLLDER
jgi:hypothetical protein